VKRAFAVLCAIAIIAGLAYAYYPPFRLFSWYVAGRSPQCPLPQAVLASDHLDKLKAAHNRILKASKLLEQDPTGYDLWETPKGRYWIPKGDKFVLPFNLAEQDVKIYGTGPQDVQKGDIVLDCGANIGVFTHEALAAGASKVIAIEPAPDNLECLRRNYKDEIARGQVIVVPKGVWDKDDTLTLAVDPNNTAADSFVIRHEGLTPSIQVPLTTIDKLVAELKLPRVDYIKMDIEGAEPNALQGARETLKTWTPRISISSYHQPDHPVRIPKIILETNSDYRMECGPCAEANGHIRPDVLYFRTQK
jgi:FkbM family methyltransferase